MTLNISEIEQIKFIALTARGEHDFETRVVEELGSGALAGWREYQLELRQSDLAIAINALARQCAAAAAHWYIDGGGENIDRDLMLIVSEAVEGYEAFRRGDGPDDKLPHRRGLEAELADLIIRALSLAARRRYDIGGTIIDKLAFNQTRPDHSPEARRDPNGKRF
jgi:hypothetical protein